MVFLYTYNAAGIRMFFTLNNVVWRVIKINAGSNTRIPASYVYKLLNTRIFATRRNFVYGTAVPSKARDE